MEVVINACYGGFSISPKAVKRYLELQDKKGYFFSSGYYANGKEYKYKPVDIDQLDSDRMGWVSCYTVPNPEEVSEGAPHKRREDYMVDGELDRESYEKDCDEYNKKVDGIHFDEYGIERNDSLLIQVIEELGEDADGAHAQLKIIDIPDDVEWHIEEYDGFEHIAENHRTWG